ncbi:MAG: hypothetical protein KQA35_04010 [Candidatus Aenigmarchaeota archaeon]|nr:hypothetical protein [Candidatus Aenigmarchaeota archaeon]
MTKIDEIYKKFNEVNPLYRGTTNIERGDICGAGCYLGCLGEEQDEDGNVVRTIKSTLKWAAATTVFLAALGN